MPAIKQTIPGSLETKKYCIHCVQVLHDFGEHGFDNWDIREQKRHEGNRVGYDVETMLFLDPTRFQDGNDDPCHSADFRTRFWTHALQSRELDMTVLFDQVRFFQKTLKEHIHAFPGNQDDTP